MWTRVVAAALACRFMGHDNMHHVNEHGTDRPKLAHWTSPY